MAPNPRVVSALFLRKMAVQKEAGFASKVRTAAEPYKRQGADTMKGRLPCVAHRETNSCPIYFRGVLNANS